MFVIVPVIISENNNNTSVVVYSVKYCRNYYEMAIMVSFSLGIHL